MQKQTFMNHDIKVRVLFEANALSVADLEALVKDVKRIESMMPPQDVNEVEISLTRNIFPF